MGLGKHAWKEARAIITRILSANEGSLRDNADLRSKALVRAAIPSKLTIVKGSSERC